MKFEWEHISDSTFSDISATWRAKVPGGWLIKEESYSPHEDHEDYSVACAICFFQDPEHKWEIE